MMRASRWELIDSDSLNKLEGDELEEMLQAEDLCETGKALCFRANSETSDKHILENSRRKLELGVEWIIEAHKGAACRYRSESLAQLSIRAIDTSRLRL